MLNDDMLTSISSATVVLLDGSDVERMAILFQFPQLLQHCPEETLQIMVPEICRDVLRWKDDLQMATAEALYFVVNMKVPHSIAKRVVIAALRVIEMSENSDVFDAWGEILSMMVPQVKRDSVLSLVVPATLDRAKSNSLESRRLAARIIGAITESLNPKELEEVFLKNSLQLCTDEDPSVRAMMAQSLVTVGCKISWKTIETQIWPILEHLMQDDNGRVRAASMRAIACTAEKHKEKSRTSKSFKSFLLPMFLKWCKNSKEIAGSDLRNVDDDTYLMLEIFSEVFGHFLIAVSSLMKKEEYWDIVLISYRQMVTCNGPTVRHWCAFNLPAIALTCGEIRPQKILGVVNSLCTDSDVETRATMAAGMHETTRLLSDGPLRKEIFESIPRLMTDENSHVRENILKHFSEVLLLLRKHSKSDISGSSSSSNDLGPIMKSLGNMSDDNWRSQELLANQIGESAYLIPQDLSCEFVAPLLFQMARESTYLVRKSSISALIRLIRQIPDTSRRDHILKHLRSTWARGKVFWTRIAYIDGCTEALKSLSSPLFKSLFYSDLMSLCKDPVPNVRIRLARLMPRLSIFFGKKRSFNESLQTLLSDKEDDVRKEAENARKLIKSMPALTKEEKAEDLEKEAMEKEFYFSRKKERGSKKEKEFKSPPKRKTLSFTNNLDNTSGTLKTVIVHSVLGSSNSTKSPVTDIGPALVEGQVLTNNSVPQEDDTSKTEPERSFQRNSKPKEKTERKKYSPVRLHNVTLKKKSMCGCFGAS